MPFTAFSTLGKRHTPGQRALWRVAADDFDPCDLDAGEYERGQTIWACDRIPPELRRFLFLVKGREIAGTRDGGERCLHLGATADLSRTDQNELVYVVFCGPKLRHARIGLRFARSAALHHGFTIIDDSNDGFTLIRHDGRHVRFEAFAASRGGDTLRGVPIIAALLDEAAFFFDEATGVANGEAIFAAIVPRLLPGGQILVISSPWAEAGLLHTEFSRNYGHPTTGMAAHCPTIVMRDDPETLAMVEAEYQRDIDNAQRELGAEFLPVGSGFYFDQTAITLAIDPNLPATIALRRAA